MRKFRGRRPHSLPFGLFLTLVAALLLPAALAPRAHAGSTDYRDSELFSQSQGTLINQSLAANYNSNMALSLASAGQPGAFQPLAVDALFSWTGATSTAWALSTNWTPAGPPGGADTAVFNTAFTAGRQPNLAVAATVGSLFMTDPVAQNVTVTGSALTINGVAGSGILINNTNAFTLTVSAPVIVGGDQAWTNNSGNLFTVGGTVALTGNDLTVNGTGNTTISGAISGAVAGSTLTKDGTGTLITTGNGAGSIGITVNAGTLLVNGGDLGTGNIVVNSGGTLGGTSGNDFVSGNVTVAAGGNLSPGNGGNTIGDISPANGVLTLAPGSNFRVDLNGTNQGVTYDHVTGGSSFVFAGSNLVVHVGFVTTTAMTFTIFHQGGGFGGQQFAQGTSVAGDDGKIYSITYTGDNIILQWTGALAVPEPSTYISGALAIAGLAFTQRRRLRKLIARRCAVGS